MLTFIKAQASSLIATFLDFSTAIVLVNFFAPGTVYFKYSRNIFGWGSEFYDKPVLGF